MSAPALVPDSAPVRIHVRSEGNASIWDYLRDSFPQEVPPTAAPVFSGTVEVMPGAVLDVLACGNHVFVGTGGRGLHSAWSYWDRTRNRPVIETTDALVTTRVVGQAFTVPNDTYRTDNHYQDNEAVRPWGELVPYAHLNVEFFVLGADPVTAPCRFRQPTTGTAVLDPNGGPSITVTSEFFGLQRTWTEFLFPKHWQWTGPSRDRWYGYGNRKEEHTTDFVKVFYRHLKGSILPDGPDAWWQRFFQHNANLIVFDDAGLSSVLKRKDIKPVIERLKSESPVDWTFFQWLTSGATYDKHKNNALLSAMLLAVGSNYDNLLGALQTARIQVAPTTSTSMGWRTEKVGKYHDSRRAICLTLPGAQDKVQDQEAKADFTKRKGQANQADGLGVTKDNYPKLRAAIEAGDIPITVFNQPDKQPINREFPLWEKSLGRKGWAPVLTEIAQDAARRGTYERDITPFLAFMFRIETYLKKHSGRKWTAMPKYVQSQWDLEMDDPEEGSNTVKRRSAFTPIADNDTGIITVPYVAVRVSGVRTQWCYARHYHVFEEGMTDSVSGGIVVNDLEEKLNGRDDYGLCFYTLTGTDTARGYPTFLIIFERLKDKTRVHFHRVRPQRSKDGVKTPACELVAACYQYMAGNVPASDIVAQQGDLLFVKHPHNPIQAGAKVKDPQEGATLEFESHRFSPLGTGGLLSLYESEAKTPPNRLGFLNAPNGLRVDHPEHDAIQHLEEGWYEIRRCRSWEANPKAIWSRTID